jgi:hypothetical protein
MPMEPIAGYNPDGSPYYGPDQFGMYIGRESDNLSNWTYSGTGSTAGSGLPGSTLVSTQTPISTIPTWSQLGDAILQGLSNPFATLTGQGTAQMNAQIAAGQGPVSGTLAEFKNWSIARVVTILLGIILIVVGLFALAKGPAVQIVSSSAARQLTS